MTRIETDRLLLRPAEMSDVGDLFAVYSDPDAMRYWDTLPHRDETVTAAFVRRLILPEGVQLRYFVIEHDGRAVGTGGFWRHCEVGYILHPRLWGQGMGGELLGALIDFGFGACGMDRVTAEVDPGNAASIAMLTRAGFAETGRAARTLELAGTWYDSVYFELRPAVG